MIRWKSILVLMLLIIITPIYFNSVDAESIYSATVPAFFGCFDVENGIISTDPTVLIVTFSDQSEIEDLWKPALNDLTDSCKQNDIVFDIGVNNQIFLNIAPDYIIGAAVMPDTYFDSLDKSLFSPLSFEMPSETITFTNRDLIILQIKDHAFLKLGNFVRMSNLSVKFDVAAIPSEYYSIPEPTMLTLFVLSLIGLFGVIRLKRRNAQVIKTFMLLILAAALLNISFPAAAQTFSCDNVTQIPKTECEALTTLYNNMNGANWKYRTGWMQTNMPCSWYGVTCSGGYITNLNLQAIKLTGSIPIELGNLTNLQSLNLSSNQLTGSIPSTIGNLTNLQTLFLNNSTLSGSIPRELGNLTRLQTFKLSGNQLTGNIPAEIGNLANLQTIQLEMNQLSGNIPATIGHLINLQALYLYNNKLSGAIPSELGNLTRLQTINLGANQLTGSIPTELGNLVNLQSLSLHNNQLTGNIPATIGNLNNLQFLSLVQNKLNSSIPPELGNLTHLQTLNLVANQLTGNIPIEFGKLVNLQTLQLNGNQLSGVIPSTIGNLTKLQVLSLDANQLSGNIPVELGNLINLRVLSLPNNRFSGEIPQELGNLIKLQTLYLYKNELNGNIPVKLGNLINLQSLYLDSNRLSGSIPSELGNLIQLQYLSLHFNGLTGSIPSELGSLSNLQYFILNDNRLSGSIPLDLGKLTNLQQFNLYNNQLSGNIPSTLGNLINLRLLLLYNNQLTGVIPPELGNLKQLQVLNLSNNQLNGNIPSSVSNLSNLQNLYFYSNQLTGALPLELATLIKLNVFEFGNTNLCEPQDAAFQAWLNAIPNLMRTNTTCVPEIKEIKTLILTNRQQLANLHGSSAADQVMSKLKTFAAHSAVSGMIAQVENDATVAAAYAARGTAYENKDNTNAVADAIKQVILKEWNAHPELEYLVIVGDDRVIPFYRAKDGTTIPDPWTLTDDFYVSRSPEFFLPELASGRLVESPSQIIGQLDAFLSKQDVTLREGVVTGYDAFKDGAQYQCATLQDAQVASDCSLIGNAWTSGAFRAIILNEPHDVVSINNHADSHGFGTPDGGFVSDSDIAAAATDFSRAIWYSIGCHAGLNLAGETDLAETLAAKRAIYAANTGYGWGGLGVVLSEKLMWYFTRQLTAGAGTTAGNALISAKQAYYSELPFMNARHEKILTENTLYGLPMYRVSSPAAAPAPVNPISVTVQASPASGGLFKETRAYSWALPTPENGYYALNGNITDENGKPVLPALIDDLATIADRVHGVVFMGGVYAIVNAAPPLQEIITTQTTASFSGAQTFASPSWYPATFGAFNTLDLLDGRRQTLIATAGQYNPNLAAGQQRIFTAMTFDVYAHANSTDFIAPTLSGVTATLQGNTATITAQANDASGIETVVAAYTDGSGAWQSVNLTQTGAEWMGSIPAAAQMEFFAQAVDKAGNVAVDDHEGAYFTLPMFTVRKAAKNTGSGVIMLGKERCDADCMELSVPVSPTTTVIVKAVAAPDSRFVRWERPDGTPIAQHNFRAKPGDLVIAVFERKK